MSGVLQKFVAAGAMATQLFVSAGSASAGTAIETNRLPPATVDVVTPPAMTEKDIKQSGDVVPQFGPDAGSVVIGLTTKHEDRFVVYIHKDPDGVLRADLEGRNRFGIVEGVDGWFKGSAPIEQRLAYWANVSNLKSDNGALTFDDQDMQVPHAADTPEGRARYKEVFKIAFEQMQVGLRRQWETRHTNASKYVSTVHDVCGYSRTSFSMNNGSMNDGDGVYMYAVGTVTNSFDYPIFYQYNRLDFKTDGSVYPDTRTNYKITPTAIWTNADVRIDGQVTEPDPENPKQTITTHFTAQLKRDLGNPFTSLDPDGPVIESVREDGRLVIERGRPVDGALSNLDRYKFYRDTLGQMAEDTYARDVEQSKTAIGLCSPQYDGRWRHHWDRYQPGHGGSRGNNRPGLLGGFMPKPH